MATTEPTNSSKQHKRNPQIRSNREVESGRERERERERHRNKRESKSGEGASRLSLRDERDNKNK